MSKEKTILNLRALQEVLEDDERKALRIADLETRRKSILDDMIAESPFIQAADEELEGLRKVRTENAKRIKSLEGSAKQYGRAYADVLGDAKAFKKEFDGALTTRKTEKVVWEERTAHEWFFSIIEQAGIELDDEFRALVKPDKKAFQKFAKNNSPEFGADIKLKEVIRWEDNITMAMSKSSLAKADLPPLPKPEDDVPTMQEVLNTDEGSEFLEDAVDAMMEDEDSYRQQQEDSAESAWLDGLDAESQYQGGY